jgi:hypothetical protein
VSASLGCLGDAVTARMPDRNARSCADSDCLFRLPTTTTTVTSTTNTSVASTTTSTTFPPSWAAIYAEAMAPSCGGCHGGGSSGGLGGFTGCAAALASMVDVPSTRLPGMLRIQPGQPASSWLVHKLDGTHVSFTADCVNGACGARMPINQPPLSSAIRDALRTWIQNGAANDCPPS